MGFEITDGTGKGNSAGVDLNNRLLTNAVTETVSQFSAENGDAYFIGTPLINLTNASESAIFYCENNENEPLILSTFFLTAESTTGGAPNMFRVNWYKNPTSISSGTTTQGLNQNFGSSNELNAIVQFGRQGSTVTGGGLAAILSFPIGQFNQLDANLILEKGSSFVITVTPPVGNTSMNLQFGTRSFKYNKVY